MNNKGFTLVEMLAVVVILAIVSGIAINGVISYIDTSKKQSEQIFVENLSDYIDNYLDIEGSSLNILSESANYTFEKCRRTDDDGNCISNTPGGTIEKSTATASELTSFNLLDITTSTIKLVDKKDLINPKNKKECFDNSNNPIVRVFKDTDYVYYYYVELNSNKCEIGKENKIVTNIPKKLCADIKNKNGDDSIGCNS